MSSPHRIKLVSCVSTQALANPFDDADDYLLDTSNWTAEDWGAAIILAETLRMRNATKSRDTGKTSNNQGSIRGMWKDRAFVPPAMTQQLSF